MNRRELASWLTSPGEVPEAFAEPQAYRGEALGLPPEGAGAVTPVWRRVLALLIDWFSALLVARLVGFDYGTNEYALVVLLIFAVQVTVLQWLMGSSFGQRIMGVAVVRIDGGRLGILPLLMRTLLICLLIPPVVWDRDTRGLHDRAARTVCVLR